jgi:putative ABC transport system permease protein
VLGALAVGFGVNVLAFVGTYEVARHHDTTMGVGSDVRVVPAQVTPAPVPPLSAPDVAASTPIRNVSALVGTDRVSALVVDRSTYRQAVTQAPIIQSGGGLDALFGDPQGVLIQWEFARDFSVAPGDPLNVTFTDPATKVAKVVTLHTIGVYRAVPPSSPGANFMMASSSLPIPAPAPDFYLARVAPGHSVAEATSRINQAAGASAAWKVATVADALQREQNTLSSLDLRGLSRLEAAGTALIAALGVAVLGAFLVLERRREFSVLRSVGASTGQLLTGPALEGSLTIGTSLLIGIPVGLIVATISTRVLSLLFSLPAPFLRPPGLQLGGLGLLVAASSAVALAASLLVVARLRPAAELRGT